MAFFQIMKLHVIVGAIWKAVEQLIENAGKKGGDAVGRRIEQLFSETARPKLLDLIYNHMGEAEGISEDDAEKASANLKNWIEVTAKGEGKENDVVRALCRVLLLDPTDEKGNFTGSHQKAINVLASLGIGTEEEFFQAVELLKDDYVMEKITHFTNVIWKKMPALKLAVKNAFLKLQIAKLKAQPLVESGKKIARGILQKAKTVVEKSVTWIDADTARINKKRATLNAKKF